MTSKTRTASGRLRRLMPAALIAAAAALGGSTLADPAIASAAPEWDIEAFDYCMDQGLNHPGVVTDYEWEVWEESCCTNSGGVWNDATKECGAPPATDVERTSPPRVAPGAETTAPLVPITPTTQPFAPGPARQVQSSPRSMSS
jgi:hypothetical protein